MKYTVTQRKSDRRHTYSRLAASAALLSTVSACTTMAPTPHTVESQACPGTTEPPPALQPYLAPVQDPMLLAQALGAPGKGGLCDGQVYEVTSASSIDLFRAWNGSNDGSRMGHWWALNRPTGKIADYELQFDICYQWPPLDKLSHCTLVAGARLVLGPGQSAQCPQGQTLPASSTQQVYLADATTAVVNCTDFYSVFQWQPAP